MKKIFAFLFVAFLLLVACTGQKPVAVSDTPSKNDTIRIANDELQYEVLIIDAGFNSWFATNAKPRQYYSQTYLEARNRVWVDEWNRRATNPQTAHLFDMPINYEKRIDYGYEVNYMLFNYLSYFQIKNKIRLGGFAPLN